MEENEQTSLQVVLDRIEGSYALLILIDGQGEMIQVPVWYLPGVKEGDYLLVSFQRDETGTKRARESVAGLVERIQDR
jgi:hypothetical protein